MYDWARVLDILQYINSYIASYLSKVLLLTNIEQTESAISRVKQKLIISHTEGI